MVREVKLRRRDAALVMSKRLPVRLSEVGGVLMASFGEVYADLSARGIEPEGPPFVIYHEKPVADQPFDLEVCAPVVRAADPPAGWQLQKLPAGLFASLVHVGPYERLHEAYDALHGWIVEHDIALAGPPREVYLSEPGTPPEAVRTVIEFPVLEVALPVAAG